jgi:ferredoxin-NADP reductase
VDEDMLGEVAFPGGEGLAFVCGPTRFVEAVADGLLAVGYAPERVRTERFGPTGG